MKPPTQPRIKNSCIPGYADALNLYQTLYTQKSVIIASQGLSSVLYASVIAQEEGKQEGVGGEGEHTGAYGRGCRQEPLGWLGVISTLAIL